MRSDYMRFLYMIVGGICISILLHYTVQIHNANHNPLHDYIASILITILVWEGNLQLDHWLNRKFPWDKKLLLRVALQLPISIIFSAGTIYLMMQVYDYFVCALPQQQREVFMTTALIVGTLISILILMFEISVQFFRQWKKSLVEVEHYKTQNLQAQLQNLKNQINPHFLFNNLSVLSSLVYIDQDKAVDFINQLSKVYRYLLDSRNKELVTVSEELVFIKSYTYLLKIRFDTNITFEIAIEEACMDCLLPPMALQMLVENAIKHNEVSAQLPLHVKITNENDYMVVQNNLQLRIADGEISTKTGINNIKERYRYFTEKEVIVELEQDKFNVKIPILKR